MQAAVLLLIHLILVRPVSLTQLTENRHSQTQLSVTVEYTVHTDCDVIKQCDFEKNLSLLNFMCLERLLPEM